MNALRSAIVLSATLFVLAMTPGLRAQPANDAGSGKKGDKPAQVNKESSESEQDIEGKALKQAKEKDEKAEGQAKEAMDKAHRGMAARRGHSETAMKAYLERLDKDITDTEGKIKTASDADKPKLEARLKAMKIRRDSLKKRLAGEPVTAGEQEMATKRKIEALSAKIKQAKAMAADAKGKEKANLEKEIQGMEEERSMAEASLKKMREKAKAPAMKAEKKGMTKAQKNAAQTKAIENKYKSEGEKEVPQKK